MRYCCNKMLVKCTIIYRNQSAKKKQKMVSIQKTFLLISLLCTIAIVDTGCQKKIGLPCQLARANGQAQKTWQSQTRAFSRKICQTKRFAW